MPDKFLAEPSFSPPLPGLVSSVQDQPVRSTSDPESFHSSNHSDPSAGSETNSFIFISARAVEKEKEYKSSKDKKIFFPSTIYLNTTPTLENSQS